ncbi:MAG: hypothetical protein ACLPT4_16000 [Verrucomicrobiia bacterium]
MFPVATSSASPLSANAQPASLPTKTEPDSGTDQGEHLLTLARQTFTNKLSHAEELLFQAAANGQPTVFSTASDTEDDPSNAQNWSADRSIAAEKIAWLCTDPTASRFVTYQGIRLGGVRIDGPLNLAAAKIPFPLQFVKCAFSNDIYLSDAELQLLSLNASQVKIIWGHGLKVVDDVSLRDLKAECVILLQATIHGTLDCSGAHIVSLGVYALRADDLKIDGNVLLRYGFIADGLVRLSAAKIGGDLDCSVASIFTTNGLALSADFLSVAGKLSLWQLKAEGQVDLTGATIGETLLCSGAQINNTNGIALNADGVKVGSAIFLREGFTAEGEVNFVRAKIGGNLECDGAQIHNRNGMALNADGAKIEGPVFLRNGFKAEGQVNFVSATIGGNLDCAGAQINSPNGVALNACDARIEGNVYLWAEFKAEGEVNCVRTAIRGNLDCIGAQISNTNGIALNANSAKVEGAVFLREGFKADGELNFVAATIAGDLDCGGSWVGNTTGIPLDPNALKLGTADRLHEDSKLRGLLDFSFITVGQSFQWRNISADSDIILDLRSARIGTLQDETKSWPGPGKLFLDGFVYDEIANGAPTEATNRIMWLHLQPRDQFLPQPYEQLASVLRKGGHEEDAVEVLIAKNQDHLRYTKRFIGNWWWYGFFGKTIGYGYRPMRAFWIGAGLIIFGFILFRLGHNAGLLTCTDGEVKDAHVKFNAFFYSLETFIPLINLNFAAHWLPDATRTMGSLLRLYRWLHIIMGWILTTLLVGALAGLIKT